MNHHTSDGGAHGEPTQGDNPGAQGDIGAGQAEADETDPQLDEDDDEDPEFDEDLEALEDYVDRDPGEDAVSVQGGNADR